MHPILFSYSGHQLYTYAFLYYVAAAVAGIGFSLELERSHWPVPDVPFFLRWLPDFLLKSIWFAGAWIATSLLFVGFAGAFLIFDIIQSVSQGWGQHLSLQGWAYLFYSNAYNSMWFGGFLLCLLWSIYLARKCRMPYLRFVDIATMLAVLGQVPGRLGCFFGGCCYGKPTTMPWGIKYESADSLMHFPHGTILHPSQLYEMVVAGVLFAYMWRKHKDNAFDGQTLIRYLIWGGLARVVTEIFRYDTPRGLIWPWMSYSQGVGICLAVTGTVLHFVLKRKTGLATGAKPALA